VDITTSFKWQPFEAEAILDAFIVQFNDQKYFKLDISEKRDQVLYLVIQLDTKVLVINLTTDIYRIKDTNSDVPMVLIDDSKKTDVSFYIHCNEDAGLQSIVRLEIKHQDIPIF
jgi:hypothetical protein